MNDEYMHLDELGDISLLKDVARGRKDAFMVLIDRYVELVSRISFRILCDREDSEAVTVKVFGSLWHDVLDFDDRYSLREWIIRKTCVQCRMRIVRRRCLRVFGVRTDVFVEASPKVWNEDDFVTKQAWELYCRASSHMTPLQSVVYTLCELEDMLQEDVSRLLGLTHFRISLAFQRGVEKVRSELGHFHKENDYDRYVGFLKKVAESLTDKEKLTNSILRTIG